MNLDVYLKHIKENGYKCTPQRLKILSYFIEQKNRLVSAKSVTEHLRTFIGNISVDTVYRNLYLFKDIGLIEITFRNGEHLFHLKNNLYNHQHLFICTECLTTTEIDVCPMKMLDATLTNYRINHHKFEIYGLCPTCV
ncbi:Fur family zinc uptake transcriptional regulator [Bacillus sp. V2I10]|nr:Fur family zinc uptake transcriptional regulator [Bacillus sp. V2I10]